MSDFHAVAWSKPILLRAYRGECITVISSGLRYFHGERYDSRCLTKQRDGAHLSGFTRILAPGADRAVNNKLYQFVSRTRASERPDLRGWRVACVFQGHRSTRLGQAKAWKKKAGDAGEASGIEKRSQKGKWCAKLMGSSMRERALTYHLVYASNNNGFLSGIAPIDVWFIGG